MDFTNVRHSSKLFSFRKERFELLESTKRVKGRQSIDLYSSVPSPSINFLGTPSLSRLSSSFLSSSLTKRHTPEVLPTLHKPLLPPKEEEQQRRSSHSLLPPIPSRSSVVKKVTPDGKVITITHEVPMPKQSSFGQAVLNGINVLCGVGILSTPYAVKEGGWFGLPILFIFAVLSYYTGILLRSCLDSQPGLETYPDIGQAAFGSTGRVVISACCVEYIILEGDNLSSLFPNAHLNLGGLHLDAHHVFALMATLAVLPTTWLRDLTVLSYISAGGVVASLLVVAALYWAGLVDNVGFESKRTTIESIHSSSCSWSLCFGIVTLLYAGTAVMGYMMFGDSSESQFTLNMPNNLVSSKVAVWTTVGQGKSRWIYSIFIRTALVVSSLIVGLLIPFFGLVMSLIGSFLTMLVTLILPCACYLSILRGKISYLQASACVVVMGVGVVSSAFGTYSAIFQIVESLSG
nr:vacuolar amino acid transporter 1 [Ipomoea batatas]